MQYEVHNERKIPEQSVPVHYAIGQCVWVLKFDTYLLTTEPCPECQGAGYFRFAESEKRVTCRACQRTGKHKVYKPRYHIVQTRIKRVHVTQYAKHRRHVYEVEDMGEEVTGQPKTIYTSLADVQLAAAELNKGLEAEAAETDNP